MVKWARKLVFIVIGIGVAAAGATVALVLEREKQRSPRVFPASIAAPGADLALKGVRFSEVRSGVTRWQVEASSAQYYQQRDRAYLDKVKAVLYAKDGRTVRITGDRGEIRVDERTLRVEGNVVVTTSDGSEMRTASLTYSDRTRRITTPDRVRITSAQVNVNGVGMVIDVNAETYRILSGVTTERLGP